MSLFGSGKQKKGDELPRETEYTDYGPYDDYAPAEYGNAYDGYDDSGDWYDDPDGAYYEDEEYGNDEGYDAFYAGPPANEFGESEAEIDAAVRRYRKKRRRRRLSVTLAVLVLLFAAGALAMSLFVRPPEISTVVPTPRANEEASATQDPDDPEEPGVAIPEEPENGEEEEPQPDAELIDNGVRKEYRYTFLIVGMDQVESNTDTIMVGTLDVKDHWLHVVSIPRDTMVNVPWPVKKINTIYAFSTMGYSGWDYADGMEGLRHGVADIMGYEPDCWAFVDIEAFQKLVDAIGGVDYDVPIDMHYGDPDQNLRIDIDKGYQHLTGEQALWVMRFRSGYFNADLGRIGTQQDFLKTVAKQMLTLGNIPNLPEVYRIYDEYVYTNLSSGNIAWFIKEFMKLDPEDITFQTLNGDYSHMIGDLNYGTIYIDEWLALINSELSPLDREITVEDVDIIQFQKGTGAWSTSGEVAGGKNSFYNYNG